MDLERWKDGYEELLKSIGEPLRENDIKSLFLGEVKGISADSKLAGLAQQVERTEGITSRRLVIDFLRSLLGVSPGIHMSSWASDMRGSK